MQTMETMIRRRVLRRLIWVCTVCQLPFYGVWVKSILWHQTFTLGSNVEEIQNDCSACKLVFFSITLQLRMWSQPDMVNQTLYAMDFATKAYAYFTDFFEISDVVPKAGMVHLLDWFFDCRLF